MFSRFTMDHTENAMSPVTSCFSDTINNLSLLHNTNSVLSTSITSVTEQSKMAKVTAENISISKLSLSSSLSLVSCHQTSHIETCQTITPNADIMVKSSGNSFFDTEHLRGLGQSSSDMETQYVIVEEPIDLHNFNEFSSVQITPCTSLVLSDEAVAETNVLNTPRAMVADETDKDNNHFSTMDLLVADDDISNHGDQLHSETEISHQTNGTTPDALTNFGFQENDITSPGDTGYGANYVYQLESIVSEKDQHIQENLHGNSNSTEKDPILDENVFGQTADKKGEKSDDNQDMSALLIGSSDKTTDKTESVKNTVEVNGRATKKYEDYDDKCDAFLNESEIKEKMEQTMFSEKIGLIPTETEPKIIAQRTKRGLRTRKSCGIASKSSFDWNSGSIIQGHKHVKGAYKCGACNKLFEFICALHDHIEDHCVGGSYHYDHLLRTAYPKYDTTCTYSQTLVNDSDVENKTDIKKRKPSANIKLKAPKVIGKKKRAQVKVVKDVSNVGKRKRGRPKRYLDDEEEKVQVKNSAEDDKIEVVIETDVDNNGFEDLLEMEGAKDLELEIAELDRVETASNTENESILKAANGEQNVLSENLIPKRTQKRKMTVPRKVLYVSDEPKMKSNTRAKNENKLTCEFCPSVFQYTRGLIKHEQKKHADKMKLECDICQTKFMREYNLERHKLIAHTDGQASTKSERKGIYKGKKGVLRKLKGKTSVDLTQCQSCNNKIPTSKMDVHVRIHSGKFR